MKKDKIDIVVIANIINETIFFPDRTLGPVLGSPAAYSSLVIARSGRDVGLVTYVGDDMEGLVNELDLVDNQGFIPYNYSTTNHLIYHEDGHKDVKFVKKAPTITFEDIPEVYLQAKMFYICPMEYEVDIECIKKLYAMGKTVVVDLGGYGGATCSRHISIESPEGKEMIDTLCKNCTIIKASREDMTHVMPGYTAEEIIDYFIQHGAERAVLTRGSKGSMYQIKGQEKKSVGICPCRFDDDKSKLDFTGAGDSFGAGLVAYYSETPDIESACKYGAAVSSLVIEKSGGCIASRMPTGEQIQRRMNGEIDV